MKPLFILLVFFSHFSKCLAEAPQHKLILNFQNADSREWKSGDEPVHLTPRTSHLNANLNFRRDDRQLTLTRLQRMNLNELTSFRLRTGIQNPSALLEGTLSFKSGSGWYVHSFTLHNPGFSHLLFNKTDFKTEGTPAGWNRIEAIRFSFWPRKKGNTSLSLYSLEGFIDQLWVLNPESLATTGDETYTSRVSVRHTDRLLKGLGLPHAVKTPDEILQSKQPPSLVIIPYLPRLPSEHYQLFSRWIDQSTRFIVFESSHKGFATKLGVELGKEVSSSTVGQFDHWKTSQENFPSSIYQHAWSLRHIRPRGNAKATATWQNALGQNTGMTACVESQQGVWSNVAWRSEI